MTSIIASVLLSGFGTDSAAPILTQRALEKRAEAQAQRLSKGHSAASVQPPGLRRDQNALSLSSGERAPESRVVRRFLRKSNAEYHAVFKSLRTSLALPTWRRLCRSFTVAHGNLHLGNCFVVKAPKFCEMTLRCSGHAPNELLGKPRSHTGEQRSRRNSDLYPFANCEYDFLGSRLITPAFEHTSPLRFAFCGFAAFEHTSTTHRAGERRIAFDEKNADTRRQRWRPPRKRSALL